MDLRGLCPAFLTKLRMPRGGVQNTNLYPLEKRQNELISRRDDEIVPKGIPLEAGSNAEINHFLASLRAERIQTSCFVTRRSCAIWHTSLLVPRISPACAPLK